MNRTGLFVSLIGKFKVYSATCEVDGKGLARVKGKKNDVTNDFLSIIINNLDGMVIIDDEGKEVEITLVPVENINE